MKCPNCNKEVSLEFNVCPWCEYKPKKCRKFEHQDVWLPAEARFCPRCGEPLAEEKTTSKIKEDLKRENNLNKSRIQNFNIGGVGFNMVYVKGGIFMMGVHEVTLSDYHIGETPVTQELWEAVMDDNPSLFTGDLQRPVERVDLYDCEKFIRKLNALTGAFFRLPSEAEWEYAARGGNDSKGYLYSGSNDIDDVAWYYNNSSEITHPVKSKKPNELGLYDMSGNVWERCVDNFGCGGSWFHNANFSRVSYRRSFGSFDRYRFLGLRLVLQ